VSGTSIYAKAAAAYRAAGWGGVLPMRERAKVPLLAGFTGYDGAWPTETQIADWMGKWPDNNLGLRVEYGILVLDVDNYDGKTGGQTLAEAERRWGPLPPTYRSTSRLDDPVSGQRFYRVPLGLLFRPEIKFADLGLGHVETIQPHLRVSVVWPSIHPKTGEVYRWFAPDDSLLHEGFVPRPDDSAELSPEWVDGLAKDALLCEVFDGSAPNRDLALGKQVNAERYERLIGMADEALPEPLVAARLDSAMTGLTSGTGSRYDHARDNVAALMRLKAVGRAGVP